METISDRLGRVSKWRWSRLWFSLALIFLGAAVGAFVVMPAFLDGDPEKSAVTLYWLGMVGAGVLAAIFGFAGVTTQVERADSIKAIKADLDKHLQAYSGSLTETGKDS